MSKWYFTFGFEGHPYIGGWVEIIAKDYDHAVKAFDYFYEKNSEGIRRCCTAYSETEFKKTKMFTDGNFGHRAWAEIIATDKSLDYREVR